MVSGDEEVATRIASCFYFVATRLLGWTNKKEGRVPNEILQLFVDTLDAAPKRVHPHRDSFCCVLNTTRFMLLSVHEPCASDRLTCLAGGTASRAIASEPTTDTFNVWWDMDGWFDGKCKEEKEDSGGQEQCRGWGMAKCCTSKHVMGL